MLTAQCSPLDARRAHGDHAGATRAKDATAQTPGARSDAVGSKCTSIYMTATLHVSCGSI